MTTRRLGIPRRFTIVLLALSILALLGSLSPYTRQAVAAGAFAAPPGQLVVRVVAATGQPLEALVVVQGPYNLSGRTDGRGYYRAKVPAGTYSVTALSSGISVTRRVTVRPGRTSSLSLALNVSVAGTTTSPAPAASPTGAQTTRTPQGAFAPSPGGGGSSSSPDTSSSTTSGALLGRPAKPPKVKSLKADPGITAPTGTSTVTAVVENPSGSALTYKWAASGGTISGQNTKATWTAPASPGTYTVTLTVSDARKRSSSASVSVQAVETSASEPAPTPEPSPSPSPSPSPGTRDPATWPFATGSPWNYPIGSDAEFAPVVTKYGTGIRGGSVNLEYYSIPSYVAVPTDPLRNIYDISTGTKVLKATVRVPLGAKAAQGTDGHLNIIDEQGAFVHELYHAQVDSNGNLTTWKYNRNDLSLNGAGFTKWQGSVAAGTSSLGGMIRRGEFAMGTGGLQTGIRHALQGVFYLDAINRYAPGGRSFVWPASSSDNPSAYSATGNVFMGSLLAIPPWININTLGITDPQVLEIARALQLYGVYIVDRGNTGVNNVVIRVDPQAAAEILNRSVFSSQIAIPLRYLQVVTNSHLNGYAPPVPGGGGVPLQPLAPALAATLTNATLASADDKPPPLGFSVMLSLAVGLWLPLHMGIRRRQRSGRQQHAEERRHEG